MSSAISISHLSKSFPISRGFWRASKNSLVLQDISLEVTCGEIVGILGANGAGKTTLVEILATHLLPSSGNVRICGHDVVRDAGVVRRMVGYCPASSDSFYPRLSAFENLSFFAELYEVDHAIAAVEVARLLQFVGLAEASSKSFQQLSLGMKQRLSLARALLLNPRILLLDEPTRSLDPCMQREMHRFFKNAINQGLGKTILLVTHSCEEATALCDRVAILTEGRIAIFERTSQVIAAGGGTTLADSFEYFASLQERCEANARLGGSTSTK